MMSLQVLFLLIAYQEKHWLCDYPLQTPWMLNKFKKDWSFLKPLIAHAGVHALFTFGIIYLFRSILHNQWNPTFAIVMAVFDFVIHFAMDRIKAGPKYLGRYKPLANSEFPGRVADSILLPAQMKFSRGLERFLLSDDPALLSLPTDFVDKARRQIKARRELQENRYFWWALGFDQQVHHLTHYAIIAMVVGIR